MHSNLNSSLLPPPNQIYGGEELDPNMIHIDKSSNFVRIESGCIEETSAGLQRIDPDLEMGFLAANADSGVCFYPRRWLGPRRKVGAPVLLFGDLWLSELATVTAESSWVAMTLFVPMRTEPDG